MDKLLFFLATIVPSLLLANAEDHGINWWHMGADYKDAPALGWLTITFVIFVYGTVRVVKKPLSLYLETRSEDVRRAIEEARLAKVQSEEKLKAYEEKLATLDDEIAKMKALFMEQAEAEKTQRVRQAQETQERILEEVQDSIRMNYERSKIRLADEVVAQAMLIAQKNIEKNRREEIDTILKTSFIEDLKTFAKVAH